MKAIYAKDIKAMVKQFDLNEAESDYLNDIAEAIFNRLCKDFKRNVKFAVETVRMGYFTVRYIPCSECTEYWIEKY